MSSARTPSPTFSVVIPTHNRSATVGRAVRSALQLGGDAEVIVVDDASTDATTRVLQDLRSPRVAIHRLEVKSGAPTARNAGVTRASGRFIAFLDSDDVMLPGRLERQALAISRTEGAVASTGGFVVVGRGAPRHGFSTLGSKAQVRRLLRLRHGSLTSSVLMVSRDAALATLWDAKLPALQDYDYVLRLAEVGRVVAVRDTLAVKERSEQRVFAGDRVVQARAQILSKYRDALADDAVALRRHCRAMVEAVGSRAELLRATDPESFDTWQRAFEYMQGQDSAARAFVDSLKMERMFGRIADLLSRPPSVP